MIDIIINHEKDFLSGMSFLLQKTHNSQDLLKELAKREGVSALFHVQRDNKGRYMSDMSSDVRYLERESTTLMQAAQKGINLVLDPKELIFFLTLPFQNEEEAWVTIFSFDYFMQNFPIDRGIFYPSSIALLTDDGSVVTSTDSELEHTHFGDSKGEIPIHKEDKSHFFLNGKKYLAIKQLVPKANFYLLILAPHKVNFVDIPYFLLKVGVILGLIIIVGGGGTIWFILRLSKPFKHLIQVMRQVGAGDLTSRFTSDVMGFELNIIGTIFNKTVQSLTYHIKKEEEERIEKEMYATELMIGKKVQNSILPEELPKFPDLEIAARFIAAKEVGGDFYDFLVGERLLLSIADTSGKGISACLYSLIVRSILRSYAIIYQDLNRIIQRTNELLCADTKDSGIFVTSFVAFFDPQTKELYYTNCGHFPALLFRKCGGVKKLSTKGMALGCAPIESITSRREQLYSGDLLVLFTDGVIEAYNGQQELFGEKRLIEFLERYKMHHPQHIVDSLIEEVELFTEHASQYDDITIVVIRIL